MNSVRPLDDFLALLSNVSADGPNSWKANCPIHEDDGRPHDPSLHVTEAQDGKVLIHCFVCNDKDIGPRICTKFGISIRALFPDWGVSKSQRHRRKIDGKKTAEYEYRDIDGITQFKVMRYETPDGKKTFAQARPNGKGGWLLNMRGVRRIPYRLPELVASDKSQPVFIVEGEKKVDALAKWGQVATCNVGGAGKWNAEFATYFRERRVIILPDNDPIDPLTGRRTGLDHAAKVFDNLNPVAASVRILELPGLSAKGDIVDWQADGHTLAELLQLVASVESSEAKQPETTTAVSAIDPTSILVETGRTDNAAGRRLVAEHGENLRFCQAVRKWYVWTGSRWAFDRMSAVNHWASQCAWELWDVISDVSADVSPELVSKMKKWAFYANSWGGIQSSIKAAGATPEIQVSIDRLDGDPWLFNCKNGTVDLRTCELQPHDRTNLITKRTRIPFDPDADCPVWRSFLHVTFRGDVELISYLQRLCGYWATGVIREQILPILWGGGSNGKTTFLNVLLDVLGRDYAMKAPQDFLMAKNHDSHPTEKADLFGKRLVFCSETEEGRRLSESLVKELTGMERVRARRMREDFWEFDPTHKVALVTNHKPLVTGGDHGIWRRIRLIEFGQKFWDEDAGETGPPQLRQDKSLKDQLRDEYPGILRWILTGCQEWQREGEQVPAAVREQTAEYRDSQDSIGQWLSECCEIRANALGKSSDLYGSFKAWCESNGEWVTSQKRFCAALADRGFARQPRMADGYFHLGLELRNGGYLF